MRWVSLLLLGVCLCWLLPACYCDEEDSDNDDDMFDDDVTDDDAAMDDDITDDDVTDDDVVDDDVTDDDVADDDTTDDDTNDDDVTDDDVTTDGTAWEDMRAAEAEVASANFSTALVYFRMAIAKLEDDDPNNDGPVEDLDLDRCRYAQALMTLTIPLAIADAFLGDLIGADEIETMMLQALGVDDPAELPTDLITVYLLEIILPQLDQAIEWLDQARTNEDIYYRLPQIRIMLFGHAFRLPLELDDSLGEHDLGEANLLGAVYHLARGAARMLAANNIDTGAPNIDAWLYLFRTGDWTLLLDLMDEFPQFLTVHDPSEPVGVDGYALLYDAKKDFVAAIAALTDDNDGDGFFWLDDNGTPLNPNDDFVDPAEKSDDLLDALRSETDDQTDDLLRWLNDKLSLNAEMDGESLDTPSLNFLLNSLIALALDPMMTAINRSLAGDYPTEESAADGLDNDIGAGTSTALSATTLTDATASWTPGELVGWLLNPNTEQAEQYDTLQFFPIVGNTAKTITVSGDMTAVAHVGDGYSIGDGVIDDAPFDLSVLIRTLAGSYVPGDAEVGLYLTAFFDNNDGLRYLTPLWDEEYGHPSFAPFVVDETESYIDNNSNGVWDPDVDTLIDAAHSFGGLNFAADGAYQPFYFFFPDGTLADALVFGGGLSGYVPTDALNAMLSGILVSLEKGGRP